MSTNTKERILKLAAAARSIAERHPEHITQGGKLLPLAKEMMALTGCNVITAKRHLAKQLRIIRGQIVAITQHGGARPGSGYPTGVRRNGRRGPARR